MSIGAAGEHCGTDTKACSSAPRRSDALGESLRKGLPEERTSNDARVLATLQEQGRIGECCESSCQPSLGTAARTTIARYVAT